MSINTEIGGATANSYVSVASADDFLNAKENADIWRDMILNSTGTLSMTTRKENLLKQATREIDNQFRYFSSKYYMGSFGDTANYQALQFPRSNTVDFEGTVIIPEEVKYATYEQSFHILQRAQRQTNKDGEVINQNFISSTSYMYLFPWVNRQVELIGRWPWQQGKV